MISVMLDLSSPETLRKLAELPGYGWSETIIRKVDPLWHVVGPIRFRVVMTDGIKSCPNCGCDCGNFEILSHSVHVRAIDEDEAMQLAEKENPDWTAEYAIATAPRSIDVPDQYLDWFGLAPEKAAEE